MFSNIIIIFSSFAIVKSAKILVVVPTPSISHQVVFRPLIQELINRDHYVTVITTDPVYPQGNAPMNLNEIDLHDLSYSKWHKMFNDLKQLDHIDTLNLMTIIYRTLSKVFEEQLKDKSVIKLIRDKTVKFDLLILEACRNPVWIFTHIFKAPVIQVSSLGACSDTIKTIGAEAHPFLYPTHLQEKIYNFTILEKISELYKYVGFHWMFNKLESTDDKMLQNIFGIDTPPLSILKNNIDMLFLNVHPIWAHNRPVPPNVVYMWGIHKTPEKILPEDLQSYLDSSTNGAIYISFGSNVKNSFLPKEKIDIFINVLSRLPYKILWKGDMDYLPEKPDNIKFSKWFPQSDILRHPNLKLFITQGGLQSTDEAINAGVPLIGIPMFADQAYNTKNYVHFKIGIQLHLKSLTEEKFENAIKTIVTDFNSYRKNIIQLRTLMHDQPTPPLENAVWWIECVLRHGGARHLRAPAANMSWTEYYEVKLVLIILSGLLVLLFIMLLAIRSFKYRSHIIKGIKSKMS